MNEEDILYKRNAFQKRCKLAIEKGKKITALFAGWGTGKTEYVALEHVIKRQLYNNPDVLHLICANTYSQLLDSTLRPLYYWLKRLAIPHSPFELPLGHKPFSVQLYNGKKWVEFLCRSMDNINTISGITIGSAWGDEMWGTEKWTFDLIDSRVRDKASKYLQFVITSNTDDPEHWMYTDIVQKYELNIKPKEGLLPRDLIEIAYGTSYDNRKNLPTNYIEGLATTLDEQMFQRYVMSQWISIGAGKILYNFDRTKHLQNLRFEKNLPLMVSSDFNVNPMCWSIWQQRGRDLWCIDQLMVRGSADTETCCREIWNRYTNHGYIIWFGDASGKYNSTKSQNSDYDIIKSFFDRRKVRVDFRIPTANPSIRDSANAVNVLFKNAFGESHLFIDKTKCPDVILSVEGCKYKPGTHEKDDSKDKDPNSRVKTHFSDTVRYIVHQIFPLRPKTIGTQYED